MDQPNYRTAVAAEVRAEMARQRVSVVRLSDTTGIPARSLARRLRGEGRLDIEELARIAAALGHTSSDFLPAAVPA